MRERSKRTEITQDYVLQTIRDTIERCRGLWPVTDNTGNPILVPTNEGEKVVLCAFKPLAVLRGAELLGKHLKMWTDRVEAKHDVANGLAEQLRKARERVLRGMSDAELTKRLNSSQPNLNPAHRVSWGAVAKVNQNFNSAGPIFHGSSM
jgi:hypothetical protein